MTEFIQILTATVGSLGFGILFNVRGKRLLAVAVGGGAAWALYLCFFALTGSLGFSYFLVSFAVSLYAEVMARVYKAPAIIFISPSLIPLVPGASLYYTMSHALSSNTESFLSSALTTVIAAAALAIGIITATIATKLVTKIYGNILTGIKQKKENT
jgi:uncharacterized membrane protein YjjB (DUF3815 family)